MEFQSCRRELERAVHSLQQFDASPHIATRRVASRHEEGERASGGGSATSVAERCSKTGPLRMRAPFSARRAGGGGGELRAS